MSFGIRPYARKILLEIKIPSQRWKNTDEMGCLQYFPVLDGAGKIRQPLRRKKKGCNRIVSHIVRLSLAFPRFELLHEGGLVFGGIEGKAGEQCQLIIEAVRIGVRQDIMPFADLEKAAHIVIREGN